MKVELIWLIVISVLFALLNLAHLNSKEVNKASQLANYCVCLGIVMLEITYFSVALNMPLIDTVIIIIFGIVINPLLIIYPLSNISNKISMKVKQVLSKVFLIIYSSILLMGLIGMTSEGNTWGNSSLYFGFLFAIWSLPNIFLATLMSNDYNFPGIIKLITSILSMIIILATIKSNDYTGDTEHNVRTITFIMCGYYAFEGYLFIAKHRMMN